MPQKATTQQAVTSAAAYRQKREQGTLWNAPSGAVVRVRDLDISDHAVIGKFPDALQQMVYRQIEASPTLRSKQGDDVSQDDEETPFTGMSGKEMLDSEYEIGVMVCKLGWIEPRVVDTVSDPDTELAVDELDSQDRRAFMGRVFVGSSSDAAAMATFPDRSEASA